MLTLYTIAGGLTVNSSMKMATAASNGAAAAKLLAISSLNNSVGNSE